MTAASHGGATATGRPAATSAARTGGPRRRRPLQPRALPYLLLAPAVLFELLVHVIPMLAGVWMSFLQLTQFYLRQWTAAPSAGVSNYRVALDLHGDAGAALLRSLAVTGGYAVASVIGAWGLGMFGAVLLQNPFRGRGLLRTLFLVPYAMPVYAGVIIWKFMLDRDNGMVNTLIRELHLGSGQAFWLLGNNAFVSIVVVSIWRLWPFALLTLMAGLQSVPNDVYEAAAVDGATRWHQFRYLTLPMLRPVNQVLILVLFLWTFNDFNTPYILFSEAVPPTADLLSIHIYDSSFVTWNFGLGSAMSVLLLLFLLVVTAVYLLATTRRVRRA